MAKVAINLATGTFQQDDIIVGIDLGTTNSLVAYVHPETRLPAAINDLGRGILVPSVVHFPADGSGPLVGDEAKEFLLTEPARTIYSVKRLLGKSYRDLGEQATGLGYRVIDDNAEGLVKIRAGDRFFSPIELSADILRELRQRAEHALKTPVRRAVITVPAYFNDSQRQATRDAGRLAGLEVLRIINEPTAAALAYGIGLDPAEAKTVAVYDLGGGTFDISILRLHEGIFEVLSTNGDTYLGGDDFDRAIGRHWQATAGLPAAFGTAPALQQQLRLAAEMAKRYLSQHDEFTTHLTDGTGQNFPVTLSRAQFETLIAPLVQRTIAACRQAVQDAFGVGVSGFSSLVAGSDETAAESPNAEHLNPNTQHPTPNTENPTPNTENLSTKHQALSTENKIDAVLLVGGSTRVPLVYAEVSKFFGQPANNSLNPDEVVALGAAIQADILAGNRRDVLLLDVTPLTLGLEVLGGLMDPIIPRNSKIPTRAGRQYTTSVDGQINLKIAVYQGERDQVAQNRKLGEFVLSGIPAMPAGLPKVEVNFLLNADGILQVEAEELRSGTRQSVEIKPQYGLTDAQVEQMLLDSMLNAKEDVAARLLIEARTAAEQLVYQVENFGRRNAQHLTETELAATAAQVAALRQALAGPDRDPILKEMDALDELTKPYAERVMDLAIRDAMTGKQL